MDFAVGVLFTMWVFILITYVKPEGITINTWDEWLTVWIWVGLGGGVSALSL